MSGECEKCHNHTLECTCTTNCFLAFKMPFDKTLKIRSSSPIPEDTPVDEHIDGVVYNIYWNDDILPWCTYTRQEAFAIALGCQWGANEILKKSNRVLDNLER